MSKALESKSWNWAKKVQEMKESKDVSLKELAYDVGIIYEVGSDTTTMALEVFTLAMVLYPGVMEGAQKEIHTVIGPDRHPEYTSKDKLPYIEEMVKEVLRWRPVSAGGILHTVIQDDKYMG